MTTRFVNFDTGMPTAAPTLGDPNTFTGRNIFAYSPVVYDLAGNTLSVNNLLGVSGVSVPAGNTYTDIRISLASGANTVFTVGAGSIATPIYSSPEASASSSATGNVYGAVLHATNDGPATTRGAHMAGFATTGSTGHISAAGLEITPVATTSGAWGAFASLVSSGVNGIATAYGIETNGDTYLLGVGSTISPVGYTTACYRAWMATASSAGARSFQTLQNDGTEIQYIKLTGEMVSSTAVIAGTEANGVNLTQAALTRNNVGGSMTIAAGTNAGNTVILQTGGSTRLAVADTGISVPLTGVASPSNAN